MYLDNSSIEEASGVYPIDDDDYASASGSGKAGYVHAHLCVLCLCKHVRVRARAHTHTHTHTHTTGTYFEETGSYARWLRVCSVGSQHLGVNSSSPPLEL